MVKEVGNKQSKQSVGKIKKDDKSLLKLYGANGKIVRDVRFPVDQLPKSVSGRLLAQYVRVYLSHQKPATASTKERGDVRGSTRKIYRQKGTGRARHGDIKAPIFLGGGVVHGPRPYKRTLKINKKQKRLALFGALKMLINESKVSVIKTSFLTGKTREYESLLTSIMPNDVMKALVIYGDKDREILLKCSGNSNLSDVIYAKVCNAYVLMKAHTVLFTENGLDEFISHYFNAGHNKTEDKKKS